MTSSPHFGGIIAYSDMSDWAAFRDWQKTKPIDVPTSFDKVPNRIQIVRDGEKPTANTGYDEALASDTFVLGRNRDSTEYFPGKISPCPGSILSELTSQITAAHFPEESASKQKPPLELLSELSPSGALLAGWFDMLFRQPGLTASDNKRLSSVSSEMMHGHPPVGKITTQKNDKVEYEITGARWDQMQDGCVIKRYPSGSLRFGGVVLYRTAEDKKQDVYAGYGVAPAFRIQVVAKDEKPTRETGVKHCLEEDEVVYGSMAPFTYKHNLAGVDTSVLTRFKLLPESYLSSPIAAELTQAEGFSKGSEPEGVLDILGKISPYLMKAWIARLLLNIHKCPGDQGGALRPADNFAYSAMDSVLTRTVKNENVVEYAFSPALAPKGFKKTNFFTLEPV